MLRDLTRLAGKRVDRESKRPRYSIVKDDGMRDEKYGLLVKGSTEIHVSPTIYDLLLTPDGDFRPEYDKVARTVPVKEIVS